MSDTFKSILIAAGESPGKTSGNSPSDSTWVELYEEGINLSLVPQTEQTKNLFEVAQKSGAKNILSPSDFRRQIRESTDKECKPANSAFYNADLCLQYRIDYDRASLNLKPNEGTTVLWERGGCAIEKQAERFFDDAVRLIERITGKNPSTNEKGQYREKLDPFEKQC